MLRAAIGVMLLLSAGVAPACAEVSSGPSALAPAQGTGGGKAAPDKRADSTVPKSGVIHPAPDATADATLRPPNVDPGITIPPPGTPGGNPTVNPK